MIEVFGSEYLRKPTQTDVHRLLQVAEAQDFPCMLGSIDCRPRAKKRCIRRDREAAHDRIYKDYFAEDSVYNEHQFC